MHDLVVIAGLSGAGRTSAAETFEDAGWFVIDNLPVELTSKVVELGATGPHPRVALVVGRLVGFDYELLAEAITEIKASPGATTVIFLNASDDVLLARFEGTKRRHPVVAESVVEAIQKEREILEPIRELADLVIDTSEMSVHDLKSRVRSFLGEAGARLQIVVESFGYKYGTPRDADLLFDVRFLPNPYWRADLRELTGRDPRVKSFVLDNPTAEHFMARLRPLIDFLLPQFIEEGKSYLTIGLGCTGGRHRSVALAEVLADYLRGRDYAVSALHRDMDRHE